MKRIVIIVGARPNFIKVTQFKRCFSAFADPIIVHTGQHYDHEMSKIFFQQFGMEPDHYLKLSAKNQLDQIAEIVVALQKKFLELEPDLVLVVGDVNSTLAASLVASRLGIKLAHVESGLRSNDRGMPEEINRILTDRISDLCFITEPSGEKNLLAEGVPADKIVRVGNTMIDTLVAFDPEVDKSNILNDLKVKQDEEYALVTIHRPSNVDQLADLQNVVTILKRVAEKIKLVFPVHPRTNNSLEKYGMADVLNHENIICSGPLSYFDFQHLIKKSKLVITDSGGIQEETTFRQVPCVTMRKNTERPVTTEIGSNILTGPEGDAVMAAVEIILEGKNNKGVIPELWDGKASERIASYLIDYLKK